MTAPSCCRSRNARPRARRAPSRQGGIALWALGFRPFYLAASLYAALAVPLWAAMFGGGHAAAGLPGALWHAHEMVFGFALAVIVGFLFTAGRNWSGQPTPSGAALAGLLGLWLAARALAFTPWLGAALLVNVAFAWLAAAGLARALVAAGNRRNYFFVGLLVLMGAASGVMHLAALGVLPAALDAGRLASRVGLDIVLFVMAVMAGRVAVPMFTRNGVPGTQPRQNARLERAVLGLLIALMAIDALGLSGPWLALPLALAGGVLAWRQALWQPWRTRQVPLVWVLHAACAWLPLHLLLRAAADEAGRGGSVGGHPCADHRCHRRADAGDDDAHRARPHRPAAARRPRRRGDLRRGAAGRADPRRRAAATARC